MNMDIATAAVLAVTFLAGYLSAQGRVKIAQWGMDFEQRTTKRLLEENAELRAMLEKVAKRDLKEQKAKKDDWDCPWF